jgi:predicted transcriptional regulator
MQMSEFGAKKKILEVVEQLPDDATIEDAIERLYFLAKIEKGIREADAGLTVPHDEAKKRLLGE